jgi:hypothetical protein
MKKKINNKPCRTATKTTTNTTFSFSFLIPVLYLAFSFQTGFCSYADMCAEQILLNRKLWVMVTVGNDLLPMNDL